MISEPRGFGARGDLLERRIVFSSHGRFSAICIDRNAIGYMEHRDGMTAMHLAVKAPAWLCDVRDAGPYISHETCQDAIRAKAKQEKLL